MDENDDHGHGHGHGHAPGHGQELDPAVMFEQPWWDERYGSGSVWSGRPNSELVAEVTTLTPGTAVDVGCGEGADAVWLAEQGWQVTAVDFAAAALARGAEHAAAAGVGDRISWQQADVRVWDPPAAAFDLVSAQFMHQPGEGYGRLVARLATAVAPGGTLLVVGHDPADMQVAALQRPQLRDWYATAPELAARLDPDAWDVQVADSRVRDAVSREGEPVRLTFAVLRARRR